MITVVAKSIVKDGKKNEYLKLVGELIAKSQKEDGCIAYNIYEERKNPNILTFIEHWRDKDALTAHGQSEHFTAIFPQLQPLQEKETEIILYNKLI